MAKKSLEIILKNNEKTTVTNCIGIIADNKIKYNDNGILVVVDINNDKVCMTRENDEYQLKLEFIEKKESIGSYLLKQNNIMLDLKLNTNKIKITNNYINITYTFNDEKIDYTVNIKE